MTDEELSGISNVPCRGGAVLSDYTTFRLGGPCRRLFDCSSADQLERVWSALSARPGEPSPLLIGGGSNLLVADAGVDRDVVRYLEQAPDVQRKGGMIRVSAGTLLDDVARITAAWGLDGLVSCSGIPGTVGGAIAGNAGAFGEQIGDVLVDAETLDTRGARRTLDRDAFQFVYRQSALPALGEILLYARFDLRPSDPDALQLRRQEILALRASKHPDWRVTPTAGSFFKNIEPTSRAERRQAAGWFLEQAGALTMRVGGARTFPRHANIIIAEEGCRASDVIELAEHMAAAVKEMFGLELRREVQIIGRLREP
ncbi:MAG TPA: UDP-N-acetylmuramate dehydrogenase [Kiritimatiellia bacterium]|mgnify:CR=1 FL=1|nr:UDP-N-acetylmuramate dehydrogenase [Kiritimatiellia bacterium]HMO98517.1 UDP-N-acetylmuramate dehydrogenase [Kiritimatiellia bacterium]HMP95825.1 UDP-N-acetylmuramate dehydrogenase [Kiritimatiellia bacterium]